jgi:hypothetical protein
VEPLLSASLPLEVRAAPGVRAAVEAALRAATPATLQLMHGFSTAALLPSGRAPAADTVGWDQCRLLVTRAPAPPAGGEAFTSLMLHGWLFAHFRASGRKAHQKVRRGSNAPPRARSGVPGPRTGG